MRLGALLTFTMVITNAGPATATGPVLHDKLPLSVTLASVTPSQGSCAGTVIIDCNSGLLAAGGQFAVTLVVTPTATGLLTNSVAVLGSEFDPALANNTANATVDVVRDLFVPLVRR